MQTIGKRPLLIGAALGILALAGAVNFARPDTATQAEQIMTIPDRVETYRMIDEVCSDQQNSTQCLADLLVQAEQHLEQTLGATLKDTWPAARDASCPKTDRDVLTRCRIYETLKFKAQVALYRQSGNQTEIKP